MQGSPSRSLVGGVEVRHRPGVQSGDRVADRGLVGQGASRDDHVHVAVEGDQAELVGGIEADDERVERCLGVLQPVAVHRAAAVQDNLQGGRRALAVRRGGCSELEHQRDLVLVLDGDDVDIQLVSQIHVGLLLERVRGERSHDGRAV